MLFNSIKKLFTGSSHSNTSIKKERAKNKLKTFLAEAEHENFELSKTTFKEIQSSLHIVVNNTESDADIDLAEKVIKAAVSVENFANISFPKNEFRQPPSPNDHVTLH